MGADCSRSFREFSSPLLGSFIRSAQSLADDIERITIQVISQIVERCLVRRQKTPLVRCWNDLSAI